MSRRESLGLGSAFALSMGSLQPAPRQPFADWSASSGEGWGLNSTASSLKTEV